MITDLAQQIVISGISGQGWVTLDEDLQTSADSWDVLQIVLIKDFGAVTRTRDQIAAEWPIGRRIAAGLDFWVQGAQPAPRGANVWQVTLQCFGRSGSRPVKFSVTASASTLRVAVGGTATIGPPYLEPGTSPPRSFAGPRIVSGVTGANLLNSFPGITATYILINQMPPTENIGRVGVGYQTPPLTLTLRPEVTAYLNQPTLNLPHGWVLTSMPYDLLPGTDVPASLVNESWEYKPFRE